MGGFKGGSFLRNKYIAQIKWHRVSTFGCVTRLFGKATLMVEITLDQFIEIILVNSFLALINGEFLWWF